MRISPKRWGKGNRAMSRLSHSPLTEDGLGSLGGRAAAWLGLMQKREGARPPVEPLLQFAEVVAEAPNPVAVAEAVVRIAHEVANVRRVELIRERGWGVARLAAWPEVEAEPSSRSPSQALREEDLRQGRSPMIGIPARHGGRTIATLWLYAEHPRVWPTELVRTLTALATLGASAGFAPDETADPAGIPAHDLATSLPNSTFLESFLTYAVAQAQRKHEPLSLLCIGLDRVEALKRLHGPGFVRELGKTVATVVSGTLRSSDLVARLQDSRFIAVLPNARHDDAVLIAETVQNALVEGAQANAAAPILSTSIGVVSFPDHAPDAPTLLHAATEALAECRAKGLGQIYGPPIPTAMGRLKVVTNAG